MIRAIVTDIEGTTTSLAFVKEVLFPYARERMAAFLAERAADAEVLRLLDEARALAGAPLGFDDLVAELILWIDEDRKVSPLKALQGLIWEEGYRRGELRGQVYEDAQRRLREWKKAGWDLYVFSSGSVHAQKLLFAHTEYGDLTPLFSGYFDTRIGAKQEPAAYRQIARLIGCPPETILFLSDIEGELDAAGSAGFATWRLVRAPGIPNPAGSHPEVADFDGILIHP